MESKHYDIKTLNAISIVRVAERLDKVYRSGASLLAKCPWHDDKNPSLVLYDNARENHCHCFACGKDASVISYVMQKRDCDFLQACEWLSGEFGKGVEYACGSHFSPMPYKCPVTPKGEVAYIPMDYVRSKVSSENSFCKCLYQLFDAEKVRWLTEEYHLGVARNSKYEDSVMFPTIDAEGRVRNIKVQHYCTDILSPRFLKCDKDHVFWMGKSLIKAGIVPQGAEFDNNCLFGAHLLNRSPRSIVGLVESPKNALLAAMAMPQHVWVATGNKGALTAEVLAPLTGRNVMVYPDRDAIGEWREKIKELRYLANFTVSGFCEVMAPPDDLKFDIADFIVGILKP